MKLTAKIKLLPTPQQADALRRTLERCNAACNFLSDRAWETKTFRQYDLHKLAYYDTRAHFDLSAQMTVRCIAKVADAYKLDRKTKRAFKPHGSIAYDDRVLSWRLDRQTVSIWSVDGRLTIPFACGERQRALLQTRQGETDLVYRKGEFYLYTTCNVEEPPPEEMDGVLGVDLGIVNIATDSDGQVFSGSEVNNVRHRYRRLRARLQRKGTRSARRRLKQLSGKERRFAQDVNHCISKRLVAKAEGTRRAIALEDLSGIRERATVRRHQRATWHSWSFHDLRTKIAYKAALAGVPVILVDPRHTSRTCPACGCVDRRNRPDQSTFSCVACGFAGAADHIAAVNIASRGAVNRPYVSDTAPSGPSLATAGAVAPGTSSRL
ncbi:MAG: RNA-guided endonuclease InsQ/TnpB family protein [Aggregatilineaceae bacterium]